MYNIPVIEGDLLTFKCDIIVQQCNCLTISSHGLSKSIAEKYPEADLYKNRHKIGNRNLSIPEDRGVPGKCLLTKITTKDANCQYVAAIMGQWRPSKLNSKYSTNYPESIPRETVVQRELWFEEGLRELESQVSQLEHFEGKTIAFPYLIGCGLAGGEWTHYTKMITEFANRNPQWIVIYIKLA